jgi:hypothetical protein
LVISSLPFSCAREERRPSFIARVGNAYLTEDKLPTPGDSSTLTRDFINEWVTSELLFQEASRRGLLNAEEVQQQLESVRRRLTIDALLNEEIYRDTAEVTKEAITAYYTSHQNQFLLREDVTLVSFVRFDNRDVANTVRTRILRGTAWDTAVNESQQDSAQAPHILQVVEQKFFTESGLYPVQLWKVARTLPKESISFVISTDPGYYLLFLHDFRRRGELADPSYVEQEIRDLLMVEARRHIYEDLLQRLRSRYTVEVYRTSKDTQDTEVEGE